MACTAYMFRLYPIKPVRSKRPDRFCMKVECLLLVKRHNNGEWVGKLKKATLLKNLIAILLQAFCLHLLCHSF